MSDNIRYRVILNPTIHEWENNDSNITTELVIAYSKMLIDNKLNPYDYHAVLGWDYVNDDYVKNRITLILEAIKIISPDEQINNANYKDVYKK